MSEREQVELFYGEANAAIARIYVRMADAGLPANEAVSIAGTISGPHCIYAKTLPSQFRLQAGAAGGELLAEAVVTDPCFWSPLEPYRYTARVTLGDAAGSRTLPDHPFGIRRLGVRGQRLYFEGKNWVARIVTCREVDFETLPQWREVGATLLIDSPHDELCEAASQVGVLLVARVAGEEETIVGELRRLARHAAVGMALVEPTGLVAADLRDACPNVLLAATLNSDAHESGSLPTWAQLAVLNVESIDEFVRGVASCSLPVIARRHLSVDSARSVEADRAVCDTLQAELADRGDIVGYCV